MFFFHLKFRILFKSINYFELKVNSWITINPNFYISNFFEHQTLKV
jgi:hypothetical protein